MTSLLQTFVIFSREKVFNIGTWAPIHKARTHLNDTQHNSNKWHYTESVIMLTVAFFIVMLSAIMLSVIMLSSSTVEPLYKPLN